MCTCILLIWRWFINKQRRLIQGIIFLDKKIASLLFSQTVRGILALYSRCMQTIWWQRNEGMLGRKVAPSHLTPRDCLWLANNASITLFLSSLRWNRGDLVTRSALAWERSCSLTGGPDSTVPKRLTWAMRHLLPWFPIRNCQASQYGASDIIGFHPTGQGLEHVLLCSWLMHFLEQTVTLYLIWPFI